MQGFLRVNSGLRVCKFHLGCTRGQVQGFQALSMVYMRRGQNYLSLQLV